MAISFDKALGIHPAALQFRAQRAEVLANNLANADTPGFKARDIDFASVMKQQLSTQGNESAVALEKTHPGHVSGFIDEVEGGELLYRIATQPSVDGNTVDTQREIAEFTQNKIAFDSSFTFLNAKFKGLSTAIRGQ
ncbi:flagellar basal body rod protein FlgB [Aestuariirhabdus litorea]|uniref:Flagellar basal body rod protein FlgB n=1 Tax=Aestuariirhabdus litorea TaxID=2528527 RepID=A0A3P3VRD9_9GAMM|nr:flagellar basal body rod protein FlgB [Aestuariirhabdus litorea]RRJ85014.1 flagellar basal body rod protein FlgB [Aestuariirhabdus litorea]RWW98239.1 flagellar basal body rod protein FlgB [Endozoicomonadaceae bacterium GTF-13]